MKLVIFTDLDGTLLDPQTYSYREAQPGLDLIRSTRTPLVFCSSKTRAEQDTYRSELGIADPFIVEDGGAVFIHRTYFPFRYPFDRVVGNYHVVELGLGYREIRENLIETARETGLSLRGYGDMTPEEVAAETGLNVEAARRAMAREYEETLVTRLDSNEFERLGAALARRGIRLSRGGRFSAVTGLHDKGEAASLLADLYRRQEPGLRTVGIGDSKNDVSLLAAVDLPFVVQKPGRVWEDMPVSSLHRVDGVGPIGWNRAILGLLS